MTLPAAALAWAAAQAVLAIAALAVVPVAAPAAQPIAAQAPGAPPRIEAIVVHKAARTMVLYAGGRVVRVIAHIQLGSDPVGPKRRRGDGRTPEGHYIIDGANPDSAYHLSLHISYPAPADVARAGGADPGGAIFIHGQPDDWPAARGRVPGDWTAGCIALADDEIESLWDTVPNGTPIDIEP